ncbi:MAG: DNA-processing protein DprA [Clostridia bacterium]|nr:DNA-processing protein DprA [Clostridia bacterium]
MDEAVYAVWLSLAGGISTVKNSLCAGFFKSAKDAYEADAEQYLAAGVQRKDIEGYLNKDLTASENTVIRCRETGINIVSYWDETFPEKLKNIVPAPVVLYYKGELPDPKMLTVSSVGTRNGTRYGEKVAYKMCRLLAESGVTVISGMAKGNDSFALMGALDGGKPAFAVLGTGVDVIYPSENKELYNRILASGGGIISEYPPGTGPIARNFPKRNRIMAGLANGVLITEAPKSSGALITASYALEYGKDLFASPGSLFSRESDGVNMLIRDGKAKPVLNHLDILDEYAGLYTLTPKEQSNPPVPKNKLAPKKSIFAKKPKESDDALTDKTSFAPADTGDEKSDLVLELLAGGDRHISEIAEITGISASETASLLTMLELDGRVTPKAGGYFTRII